MIVTEQEAKRLWCPLVRYANGAPEGCNSNRDAFPVCIGPDCMAWRKAHGAEFDKHGNLPGYCGAFGKVEP